MAVTLEPDELARVQAGRLAIRPKYFNASTQQDTTITTDFEAFLILQDPVTVAETLTWITATGLLTTKQLERDAIAFEALVIDQQETSNALDEVDETTLLFNTWRESFQAGKFSDTPEVGLLIRDCQATADELFATQDRLTQQDRLLSRVQQTIRQGVSNAQLRELQSWPGPLLTY